MDRRAFIKSCVIGTASAATATSSGIILADMSDANPEQVRDYLSKIENFNHHFADDIILTGKKFELLKSVVARLKRLQSYVGYANFSLLSVDSAFYYAKLVPRIGEFTAEEQNFLESLFYTNAKEYGFLGEKVSLKFTERIQNRDLIKIPRTGHFIYRGKSLKLYNQIKKMVGTNITLTSGVRCIVKQTLLFLDKAYESKGNLSMASRSLAPPGHSFHGIGDFDVGKKGYGYRNFTEDFAHTDEFKRLEELGFIRIRYHERNPFGVRYEPWHIKVV
ncbi:MAG: M15 family metallopeptidase [Gammaproteobacteria bacterium]|nr:M15 family metallopeptidase [Gammaproteobacteria bacterium]